MGLLDLKKIMKSYLYEIFKSVRIFDIDLLNILECNTPLKCIMSVINVCSVKVSNFTWMIYLHLFPICLNPYLTEINTNIRFNHYSIAAIVLLYIVVKQYFCISGIIPLQFVESSDIGVCIISSYIKNSFSAYLLGYWPNLRIINNMWIIASNFVNM